MPEFYHVSRRDISTLSEFTLQKFSGSISSENMHTDDEFREYKQQLYPDGLSGHGETYLHNPFVSVGTNLAFTRNEYFIETVFELVRRLKFPGKPARFASVFGCLNVEDARKLKQNVFNGHGTIYKVSCERFDKADMSFARQVGSVVGIQIVAEKYWSGLASPNPFWEILMQPPVTILETVE